MRTPRMEQRVIAQESNQGVGDEQPAPGQPPLSVRRGLAAMPREAQQRIASLGGRAAHGRGTAHRFSSAEAREAGCKGGAAVSRDRDHMAKIGRKGGQRRRQQRAEAAGQ